MEYLLEHLSDIGTLLSPLAAIVVMVYLAVAQSKAKMGEALAGMAQAFESLTDSIKGLTDAGRVASQQYEARIETLEGRILDQQKEIGSLEGRLDEANKRIGGLQSELDKANKKITHLCGQVGVLESEKQMLAEAVTERDERIAKLEAVLEGQNGDVNGTEVGRGSSGEAGIIKGVSDPFGLLSGAPGGKAAS
jgi:chromosome segregation ATPase